MTCTVTPTHVQRTLVSFRLLFLILSNELWFQLSKMTKILTLHDWVHHHLLPSFKPFFFFTLICVLAPEQSFHLVKALVNLPVSLSQCTNCFAFQVRFLLIWKVGCRELEMSFFPEMSGVFFAQAVLVLMFRCHVSMWWLHVIACLVLIVVF